MNDKIKKYYGEKEALYANPESYKNTTLMDKELLSIANAIYAVYTTLENPTKEDTEAYNWAVKEKNWKWR